jgi:hydroxyacylglutathione hydrolase
MLHYICLTYNPFSENTYLVFDNHKDAIVIDPGCMTYQERQHLKSVIEEYKLEIKKLVNTHCHIDHVLGNNFIKNTYNVPLFIHKNELPVLASCSNVAEKYGIGEYIPTQADQFFEEGELLVFGETALEILFVPGHAPGHVAFYHAAAKLLISGDVLFKGSIGRTDFPFCNHDHLVHSIQQKLYKLPDDTVVLPGHGPKTTIGFEKRNNPFVQAISED